MLDVNPRSECLGAEQSHASNKGAAEISMLRMDQLISQKVLWLVQPAGLLVWGSYPSWMFLETMNQI